MDLNIDTPLEALHKSPIFFLKRILEIKIAIFFYQSLRPLGGVWALRDLMEYLALVKIN